MEGVNRVESESLRNILGGGGGIGTEVQYHYQVSGITEGSK